MSQSNKNTPKLTPREHIRRRPGMYVGGTDKRGLHHMIYEILDHMAEEAYINRCDHVWIDILDDDTVQIRDNSEGLPIEKYEDSELTWMEVIIEEVGVPKGKFDDDAYKVMGGLHGLGISPVNMLSQTFIVENHREGICWRKTYQQGIAKSPLTQIDNSKAQSTKGLFIQFQPDDTIFDTVIFEREIIEHRAQQIAMLTSNLTIEVTDHRASTLPKAVFHYEEGLKSWVEEQTHGNTVFHDVIHIQEDANIPSESNPNRMIGVEIAFQFSDSAQGQMLGYVNTVRTPEGGTHVAALKASLLSAINEYIEYGYSDFSPDDLLTWNDIKEGLVAIISIRHPDPQFQSPTKIRLGNRDIFGPNASLVYSVFDGDSYSNRETFDKIITYQLSRK